MEEGGGGAWWQLALAAMYEEAERLLASRGVKKQEMTAW